jgi:hypothetical protein
MNDLVKDKYAKQKRYYQKNKEILKEKKRKYIEENIEKIKQYRKEYWAKNKEKEKEKRDRGYWKEYYIKNRDKFKEYKERTKEYQENYRKEYYAKHKEKDNATNRRWHQENKEAAAALRAKRRAAKIKRTPKWLTKEDYEKIKTMYGLALFLNETTDTEWHVDHIIPLQGKLVSGLHVPDNLQVIPAKENLIKRNKYKVDHGTTTTQK